MLIIPAIDILEGQVVRLEKGDFKSVTRYDISPLEQAVLFYESGFKRIHVVDLMGSKSGEITVLPIIELIKEKTSLEIQFGGGVRNIDDVRKLRSVNIDKIILGSLPFENQYLFEKLLGEYDPQCFILAADVTGESVFFRGWTEMSGISISEFLRQMISLSGIEEVICTDIQKDGTGRGPNFSLYRKMRDIFPGLKLIASGGVGSVADLHRLKEMNVFGTIVGKAFYEGKIKLEELKDFAG